MKVYFGTKAGEILQLGLGIFACIIGVLALIITKFSIASILLFLLYTIIGQYLINNGLLEIKQYIEFCEDRIICNKFKNFWSKIEVKTYTYEQLVSIKKLHSRNYNYCYYKLYFKDDIKNSETNWDYYITVKTSDYIKDKFSDIIIDTKKIEYNFR